MFVSSKMFINFAAYFFVNVSNCPCLYFFQHCTFAPRNPQYSHFIINNPHERNHCTEFSFLNDRILCKVIFYSRFFSARGFSGAEIFRCSFFLLLFPNV